MLAELRYYALWILFGACYLLVSYGAANLLTELGVPYIFAAPGGVAVAVALWWLGEQVSADYEDE